MFLLDTNVISELRKSGTPKMNPAVNRWASSVRVADLYLSVISIAEMRTGILSIERRDPLQAAIIQQWFQQHVLLAFQDRILQIDIAIALRYAQLHVPNRHPEHDTFIAATALVHGMTVVTRNVADFQSTGVNVLNPWLG